VLFIAAFACVFELHIAAAKGPRATRDRAPVRIGAPAGARCRSRHRRLR
jgi:hypothetical protein